MITINKSPRFQYQKEYREKNKQKISLYRKARRSISRQLDNEHYARTKDRHRELTASKKYGISIEEYRELFKKHDNKCAICGSIETAKNKVLAVDHDHNTGKVRGLLCGKCNRGLGFLQDNLLLIEKIKIYLQYA